MSKRKAYLLLLAGAVLAVVVVVVFSREREPEYGGKSLSEWVDAYFSEMGRDRATEPPERQPGKVILQMGTNTLPYLVKWMGYEAPSWKTKFYNLANPILRRLNRSWELLDDRRRVRTLAATLAFNSMGTNALPALPYLHQLLNDRSPAVRYCASNLIRKIDPGVEKARLGD